MASQIDSGFSWDQVVTSIPISNQTTQSLKATFKLFEEPVAFTLVERSCKTPELVCDFLRMDLEPANDCRKLQQLISETSVYRPVFCLVDPTLLETVAVEAIEEMLSKHLSFTVVRMGPPADDPKAPQPSNVISIPLDRSQLKSKINEFLVRASKLTDHLTKMQGLEKLNERERILVQLISIGMPNKKSASLLGLAEKTIEKCRTRIYRKLGVNSTGELASLITMSNFYRWPSGTRLPETNSLGHAKPTSSLGKANQFGDANPHGNGNPYGNANTHGKLNSQSKLNSFGKLNSSGGF